MRYVPVIILLLTFIVQAVRAEDKAASPEFSSYPKTESFRYYVESQTNSAGNLKSANLLAISAFPSGDRFALRYFVTESGMERDYREVYDRAIQNLHGGQLSEADVKKLRSAIRELPAESVSPPIERLVIVSFREGTNWITRTYDSSALPKPMRQIYDIVGERSESKKDK